jgi:cob(I)alamin adenosyltransferase
MKIYTKSGDSGSTSLANKTRVQKDCLRVETYGAVDELNAYIGLAICDIDDDEIKSILTRIQSECFVAGADLANPIPAGWGKNSPGMRIDPSLTTQLENEIDRFDEEIGPLKQFILPGGSRGAASLHVARTVCRRAERRIVALADAEEVGEELPRYFNRLSDHLFVLARLVNYRKNIADTLWSASPRFNK